jgi:coenzyme F420-0:L-glutamate ligase/coenzyme F420-1:gamma-L-glutamate ligase
MSLASLAFHRVSGLPLVEPGHDLAGLIVAALRAGGPAPQAGDILAVAQKIVSKAEGRLVPLALVTPSAAAIDLAARAHKDPRVAELILRESRAVIRVVPGVIITEHLSGIVLANAGIDRSNVAGDEDTVLLLPVDADASAARLRTRLEHEFGVPLGVLITDSIGRAWRLGTTGTTIGAAGVTVIDDLRGKPDLFGRRLQVSEVAVADSLAAAAVLVMGEAAERSPVVLIRGLGTDDGGQAAATALRPLAEDLFR